MVLAHAIPPTIMRRLVTSLEIILEMIDTFVSLDVRKQELLCSQKRRLRTF